MTGKDKAIPILEKKLGKAYRSIAVGDLERLLRAELDKSAEEMDTVLVHTRRFPENPKESYKEEKNGNLMKNEAHGVDFN